MTDFINVSSMSVCVMQHFERPRLLRGQANQSDLRVILHAQFRETQDSIAPHKPLPNLGQKL
jgi:hypothetical protein